jgi:acyl-CoA synthetase (NDP forming)
MDHPLAPLFSPRSVAVVGASSDPRKLGGRPLHNLLQFGFRGRIYPVNPAAAQVQGVTAYASVRDLPEVPDQAIVVVPAKHVAAALEDCAAKGVRLVQILSAGFAEVGGEGVALQQQVIEIIRRTGMRITGPNALGSVSPSDAFYGTFSSLMDSLRPPPGKVGVVTQSGAFGSHIYAVAAQRGIGISRSIATGNEADLDVAECIGALIADDRTEVICAALEGCRNGAGLRASLRAAAAAGKPVVLMKVGSTEAGAIAAATHTGSLAGSDAVFDAVFRECGAWRARTIEEMIDVAYVCATGRMPVDDALVVVTVSGGIGVLMADLAIDLGLQLPAVPPSLGERLRTILPYVTGVNPIDTTAQVAGTPAKIVELVDAAQAARPAGTVVIYLSHIGRAPERFASLHPVLEDLRRRHPDTLLILVGTTAPEVRDWLEARGIPAFEDPSRAIQAVCGAARLGQWHRELAPPAAPDLTALQALDIRADDESAAKRLLAAAGLPVLPERLCTNAAAAVGAAEAFGFPVVAKIVSPDILHKTEAGGVLLDLANAEAVERGFHAIMASAHSYRPGAELRGVLIAPMRRGGIETIIGVQRDPVFGPIVMFGLGGVTVELYKNVAFASAPLDLAAAHRLIAAVRGHALLEGWRGSPGVDLTALADALCRISELAAAHAGTVRSIEVNPFLIGPDGGVALDALITTDPP